MPIMLGTENVVYDAEIFQISISKILQLFLIIHILHQDLNSRIV